MSTAHKGQILPIINQMIPIDKETTFHASYDHHLNGFNQGEIVAPVNINSLYFNGGEYIEIPNPLVGQTTMDQEWTIEVWIKMPTSLASTTEYLIEGLNGGLRLVNGTKPLLYLNGGINDYYCYGTIDIRDDKWHHIAFVFRNSDAHRRIYVDGVDRTNTGGPNLTNTPSGLSSIFKIGNGMKGSISELRIWNKAKDLEGIKLTMNSKLSGQEANLAAYYPLSEKEGFVSYDTSGNGNDGQWNGGIISTYGRTTTSKVEGKFRNAVLIEPDTTNIVDLEFSNWTPSGTSTQKYEIYGIRLESNGGFPRIMSPLVTVTPGDVITLSAYVEEVPSSFQAQLQILETQNGSGHRIDKSVLVTEPGHYSVTGTVPADVTTICIWLRITDSSGTTPGLVAKFNKVQVEKRDQATAFVNGSRPLGQLWYPNELINPSAFTISCWFNIPYMHRVNTNNTGINGSWHHPIMEVAPQTARGSISYTIMAGPEPASWSRKLMLRAGGDNTANFPIEDNTWYHLVATYDGTTHKIYIDGDMKIEAAKAMPVIEDDFVLMVGGGYHGKSNIKIDELRIESRAISAEEAAAWAASGLHYNYLDYSSYVD